MKKTILLSIIILLSCFAFSQADLAITDLTWGVFYDEGLELGYVDSFSISTDSTANLQSFFVGTRYPPGDMGGISLYNESQQLIDEINFLDGQILEWVTPEIVILNNVVSDVFYIGNESGHEDIWWVVIDTLTAPDSSGPIVQFNYVPEPATVGLLALGALALRRRK